MPWSPANTTTLGRVRGRGGQLAWQDASQTPSSSSRPSEPTGLVNRAWWATASAVVCSSGGTIAGKSTNVSWSVSVRGDASAQGQWDAGDQEHNLVAHARQPGVQGT